VRPRERGRGEVGRWRSDEGFATVWTACAIAVLLVIAGVVLWFGAAVAARHRAAGAADLAALAAAGQAPLGVELACAQASEVAERMQVRVTECRLAGWDALVEVEAVLPGALDRLGPARARARAGPVEPSRSAPTTSGSRTD
jgi:secretion/DNA translocation related TadE-like protein